MKMRAITFTHAQGGELAITNHTTSSTNLKLDVTVDSGCFLAATDTSGSGDAVIQAYELLQLQMLKAMV